MDHGILSPHLRVSVAIEEGKLYIITTDMESYIPPAPHSQSTGSSGVSDNYVVMAMEPRDVNYYLIESIAGYDSVNFAPWNVIHAPDSSMWVVMENGDCVQFEVCTVKMKLQCVRVVENGDSTDIEHRGELV